MTIYTTKQQDLIKQVTKDLKRDEGFRQYAYPDPLSKLAIKFPHVRWGFAPAASLVPNQNWNEGNPWTVGFGFTEGVTHESTMPLLQAERKLEELIVAADSVLNNSLSWYGASSFVTKTVLINMVFNMGIKGVLSFKNTLNYIQQKNYSAAAKGMRNSLWFRQVKDRAERLAKRMETQEIND